MSASSITSQLEGLHARIETMRNKLNDTKMRPAKNQVEIYRALASRIPKVATELSHAIQALTEFEARPTDDGIKLLAQARERGADDQLNVTTLKRNLTLIFEGPKTSSLDLNQVKIRKRALRERCATICGLRPETIVEWAISFIPSSWTPGTMSNNTFDYLVAKMEHEEMPVLPSNIRDVLHTLGAEEPLNHHREYQKLVDAVVATVSNAESSKKRKVTESTKRDKQSGRQVQYMFSRAPTNYIPLLGDLLSKAVQTSNQWETERKERIETTECLTTLIPTGEDEDISITLWVGQREGLQLLDFFKLQRTWPS